MRIIFPALFIVAISFIILSNTTNSGGSNGGKTGSGADQNNCTQCHAGTPLRSYFWITSNIPPSGYIPNQTYSITLTATHANAAKLGFEITAENAAHQKTGTFIITQSNATKLTNASHAVTHTGLGTTPNNGSRSWTFDFIAPNFGTGTFNFFAAFVAANGNMGTSGDVVYLTDTLFTQDPTAHFTPKNAKSNTQIFPNPASDYLFIKTTETIYSIQIINLQGKVVDVEFPSEERPIKLYLNALKPGVYFLQLQKSTQTETLKFIKTTP